MEIDFLETSSKAILYIYTKDIAKEEVSLLDSKRLKIGDLEVIDLYDEVTEIISIKKFTKRIEVEMRKKAIKTWYTLHGPDKEILSIKKEDKVMEDESEKDSENLTAFDLLRKIYSNADDDTKKAMEKSYLESEGTVLSTDWNEVKNNKVKPKK